MEVFRSVQPVNRSERSRAIAIGNFDGVHPGHRRLLRRVVAASREHDWIPSILTFDPHPTKIVAPDRAPRLLNTTEERWEFMQSEGIEQAFVLPFTRVFANLTPEQFVREILVEGLHAAGVFVGDNFRFGAKHAGDVELLRNLGSDLGFRVEVVPSVFVRGRMVSSTEVRTLIEQGHVSIACRLLERPFWVEGDIVSGEGIGSKKTVPTLNIQTLAEIVPAHGVYITRTTDRTDGRVWQSISNIGTRPTFEGQHRTIETFLLSPFDGHTPQRIRLEFLRRVREERKFDSPEALKTQIIHDAGVAIKYFRRTSRGGGSAGL